MHLNSSFWLLIFVAFSFFSVSSSSEILRTTNNSSMKGVQIHVLNNRRVVLDNGLVEVTFDSPGGDVIGIKYNNINNVLEISNKENDRGYWDVFWNRPEKPGTFDKLQATDFNIIKQDEEQVEISFTKKWDSKDISSVPLNVDKRYIVRRGSSGIYMYTILERLEGWPDVDMDQIRLVFKLQEHMFHYMAISDQRQRVMPTPEDRNTGKSLAYPEAVLLTHPRNPHLKGEVDDKYQYSSEDDKNKVYGWISEDPPIGLWMISPSNEFSCGGPTKQDLTAHVGANAPTLLNMFTSTHYAGKDINTAYRNGEPWKKVFGPSFLYLNSVSPSTNINHFLWQDAKSQMLAEVRSWPYNFVESKDFPPANQRGSISGQLMVRDKYVSEKLVYANSAYVGLAAPGPPGSWQYQAKGYQFWTRANRTGTFYINNVRPGNYSLYAWVQGVIGDYVYNSIITVLPGSTMKLNVLVYDPPRNGPTLWSIGIPDRSAAEFYVPDPYPTLMNRLYINDPKDKFRQYGLWKRYADLYPTNDLVYDVSIDNYAQRWFFAHVTRDKGNEIYQPTTWRIIFPLKDVNKSGNYTLWLALASATMSEIQVRFNNPDTTKPLFTTGLIGKDNAIARHGIHGLYWLFSINVASTNLVVGSNTIFLTQTRQGSPFFGVMYDYIRFEGPSQP